MSRADTNAIALLRDIVPVRPLTRGEALWIAERQALMFIQTAGLTGPTFPDELIADQPRLRVERLSPLPMSGAAHWAHGQWLIVLNAAEPATRQRFSLAHEFKHILDHRFVKLAYSRIPEADRAAWIEEVCDYFAGCLLMPRPWVKRAWTTEAQHLPSLARRFGVSQAAMSVRLRQIGLTEPTARCDRRDLTRAALQRAIEATYHRAQSTTGPLVGAGGRR